MADEAIESVPDSFALAQMGAASIFALKIATYGALCTPLIIFK
jgi:muconate cycloisomerase